MAAKLVSTVFYRDKFRKYKQATFFRPQKASIERPSNPLFFSYFCEKIKIMLRYTFLCFFALMSVFACKQPATPTEIDADNNQYFGAKITANNALAFEDLVTKMSTIDSLKTKVTGTVEAVCKKKGCWMNIVAEDTGEEMFVKFKDYGFFMPLDIAGREVVMEGIAFREVTTVDELRHYAEDDGQSPEEIAKITEPEEELKFMADGVVLLAEK